MCYKLTGELVPLSKLLSGRKFIPETSIEQFKRGTKIPIYMKLRLEQHGYRAVDVNVLGELHAHIDIGEIMVMELTENSCEVV